MCVLWSLWFYIRQSSSIYRPSIFQSSFRLLFFAYKGSQSACNISLCVFGELMIINTLKNQSISIIICCMLSWELNTKSLFFCFLLILFWRRTIFLFFLLHNSSSFIFSLVTSLSYFWTFKYLLLQKCFSF